MNLEYIARSFFSRERERIAVSPGYIKMIEL